MFVEVEAEAGIGVLNAFPAPGSEPDAVVVPEGVLAEVRGN